ncbi:MAG: hypothetical protein G4V63_30140 [Candidatus Afipia apatlaquensis]|uniref:Uncharacterized protein n=1 Tax=Candidatus Afipia apatlaquensis TaxID=2712852 RepID=A0A7C9VK78_9BRAD|nr:hypothetical protein [Candidatus Afipia apatlaquensis]
MLACAPDDDSSGACASGEAASPALSFGEPWSEALLAALDGGEALLGAGAEEMLSVKSPRAEGAMEAILSIAPTAVEIEPIVADAEPDGRPLAPLALELAAPAAADIAPAPEAAPLAAPCCPDPDGLAEYPDWVDPDCEPGVPTEGPAPLED